MLSLLSPQTNSHIIYNIHYTLYTLHIYVIHAHNLFTGLNNAQFPLGVYTVRIPSVKKYTLRIKETPAYAYRKM